MRFDKYEEPRPRTRREWLAIAETWVQALLFLAAVIAACVLLCALEVSAAAVPPRPRLARSLTGAQVARAVTDAPPGARVSVPLHGTREWSPAAVYHPGDTYSLSGEVYVCTHRHTPQPGKRQQGAPAAVKLIRAPAKPAHPLVTPDLRVRATPQKEKHHE